MEYFLFYYLFVRQHMLKYMIIKFWYMEEKTMKEK